MTVHVGLEKEKLDPDSLRKHVDINGCGSVVSFVGYTRPYYQKKLVKRLEFESWESKLVEVLKELADRAIKEFAIISVCLVHRTGIVKPSEPIVCIHVGSAHREEGFLACSWLISELKKQAPIWKKEVREDGEFWKDGLG
tara:strand:- start:602 stop:1021 length:420 start_codon:yes stop_codon:yes gene_type:complete